MAGSSLQIDDDYCKKIRQYCASEGYDIEAFINEYITILERISNTAITKGDVAEALKVYIDYSKRLKGKMSEASIMTMYNLIQFMFQIDSADKYLF